MVFGSMLMAGNLPGLKQQQQQPQQLQQQQQQEQTEREQQPDTLVKHKLSSVLEKINAIDNKAIKNNKPNHSNHHPNQPNPSQLNNQINNNHSHNNISNGHSTNTTSATAAAAPLTGYYGLGIPKSPSFHSGLDLLADEDEDIVIPSESSNITTATNLISKFKFTNVEELKAKF